MTAGSMGALLDDCFILWVGDRGLEEHPMVCETTSSPTPHFPTSSSSSVRMQGRWRVVGPRTDPGTTPLVAVVVHTNDLCIRIFVMVCLSGDDHSQGNLVAIR